MEENKTSGILKEDEKILWENKAKENDYLTVQSVNIFPVILLWLAAECLLLGFAVAYKILGKDFNTYYLLLVIAAVVLHLIPTAIWFAGVCRENARIRGDEYAITDQRLIIIHSRLHECYETVNVKDIEEMFLRRSLAEYFTGTGRIIVKTEEEEIVLHSVGDAEKAFRKAYRAVFKERKDSDE